MISFQLCFLSFQMVKCTGHYIEYIYYMQSYYMYRSEAINFIIKALLNWPNISSNITKMRCWMNYWVGLNIGLTERKNSKKRKNHVEWRKIVLDENLIASTFFIQHFQAHPAQFSGWIGLLLISSNI